MNDIIEQIIEMDMFEHDKSLVLEREKTKQEEQKTQQEQAKTLQEQAKTLQEQAKTQQARELTTQLRLEIKLQKVRSALLPM